MKQRNAGFRIFLALLGVPTGVLAQDDAEKDAAIEEVVVTGSRIAAPNLTSTSPIQVVTSQDIQLSGKSDISDVINQLPQIYNNMMGQGLGNRTSGLTTPGGVATADLRGLGPNRTLVLVNGRRLGAGSPNTAIQSPAPDLDQVPSALVDRVDVITGGASAVYGSDAMLGVINFILKRDFQGFQVDYQIGQNWHRNRNDYVTGLMREEGLEPVTGTSRDGRSKSINVVAGTNFADDRGNLTAYFGYMQFDPVASGERDFGGCQLVLDKTTFDAATCTGSANSNQFQISGGFAQPGFSVKGDQFVPHGTPGTNPPAEFNSQAFIYMGRGDQRYTAGFIGHLDVTDNVRPYLELAFMNDRTNQAIAPSALFQDANPLDSISNNYNINCSNPLLSAQQASILCTPAQIAADAADPGSVSANVRIGRRNVEGGARELFFEHTNYRAVGGLQGELLDGLSYDTYAQYYYTQFYNANDKFLNFQSISNALQVTGTAANPACISGPPCVPYNIFRDDGVTQDQLDYLYLKGTAYGTTTQRTLHADVTADLGKYRLVSPFAGDGLAVNLGYEHRNEEVVFAPDSGETSGLLSGFGGAQVAIDNRYSVDEGFVELRAPLVQEKTGVYDLVFDTGFRRSDYSTVGVVNTRKFELQYAPVRDLRLRGSYQRAIRAPTIIEFFNPLLIGQIPFGADPCAPTIVSGVLVPATATLDQCLRTGVTAAQYGNGGTTSTVPQGTAGQLSQVQGGNPDLQAERGTSYTFGMTLTPQFLPNFTGSIDYYRIELDGQVGVLPAQVIMQNCLETGDPTYCSQIVRSSTGSLTGASVAGGGYILQTNRNVSAGKITGIDVQSAYKARLPGQWGSLGFVLNGTWQQSVETTPVAGAHTYDCVGLFGPTCGRLTPRWRHNLRMSWDTPLDIGVSLTWRFLGSMKLDNNDADPSLQFTSFAGIDTFNARLPTMSYLDLSATWQFREGLQVRGGVNNLFDKDPPIVTSELISGGAANSYELYDGLGRQLFLAMQVRF